MSTVRPQIAAGLSVGQGRVEYLSGFGNGFETEALPGALPIGRNSPQKCAYGLYAEQLSGSPFTAPRATQRALLALSHPPDGGALGPVREGRYRSVAHRARRRRSTCPSRPMRWDPIPIPDRARLVRRGRAHHHHGGRCRHARPAWARMSTSSRAPWWTSTSTMPMARCCSCRSRARCGCGPSSASSTSSRARSPSSRAA